MSEEGSEEGYVVSKKVSVNEVMDMDAEDESLRKYKESLLGGALTDDIAPSDDPRRVVIQKLTVMFEDRPGGNVDFDLTAKGAETKIKDSPFTLKENCNYKMAVEFKVQHEIVCGLKMVNSVTRKGVRVAKDSAMLGSFPPQKDNHQVIFPRHGWDTAPSGMLSRGKYGGKHTFTDDDKQKHLEYDYAFKISKGWD